MYRILLILLLMIPSFASAQENRLKIHHLTYDGKARNYLSYTPPTLKSTSSPAPLIVVLHGGGGTARQISRGTKRRFDSLADKKGFFVVYPNAIRKMWDTGGGFISKGLSPRRDDLGFLDNMIDDMSIRHSIDKSRVFVTGISRGGHAAFMMACRSTRIRAIGAVVMNLPKQLTADCKRARPTGLILINGTKDPLVPYNGGRINVLGKPRDFVHSVKETVSIFARRNGCAQASNPRRIDTENDGTVVFQQNWKCTKAPISLYRVEGGGHTWPSERSVLPERVVGKTSRDIAATDVIVKFFLNIK